MFASRTNSEPFKTFNNYITISVKVNLQKKQSYQRIAWETPTSCFLSQENQILYRVPLVSPQP